MWNIIKLFLTMSPIVYELAEDVLECYNSLRKIPPPFGGVNKYCFSIHEP